MVHGGTHTERKGITELLAEIHEHRKLLHRGFIRKSDGQVYQLLAFAHNPRQELQAMYCLCAHSAIKEVMPVRQFLEDFDVQGV